MSNPSTKQTSPTELLEQAFDSENFAELFEEYEKDGQKLVEGTVVKGVIVGITDKGVAVDIGAKSVGFIDGAEFKKDGEINEGDVIDVFLDRIENKKGDLVISRDSARRHNNWNYLKQCQEDKSVVDGFVIGKVKGGYAVDVNGITCFLPKSQADTMLMADENALVGKTEKLQVLKIDEVRGNIVVSRRAILESQRSVEKDKILSKIKVGDALDGVVKNITDYGAFIDFGSFDGLLHLTDISWCRVKHPSELLKVGQEVKVQVIKYDELTKRVSLGMKQLQSNPWEDITSRYGIGTIVKGRVTNITTYGAFVEIENGIEGLVHVSEMSWLKNSNSPNKFITSGQEVDVMVLDINSQNRRISLGMKQCNKNPWQIFSETYKVGDVVEGVVKNFTEFGLFVGFDIGVDGLAHISDIPNEANLGIEELLKQFKKDDKIKVVVLGSNYEKERISLGIKQLNNSNLAKDLEKLQNGEVVSCVVVNIKKDFLEIEIDSGLKGVIKRLDLSRNKQDQRTERYEVGDRIEAKVVLFNNISGKILLSIKDLEPESQDYMYSEESSGTSIGSVAGDILRESFPTNREEVEQE